jgi:hypothetical protein
LGSDDVEFFLYLDEEGWVGSIRMRGSLLEKPSRFFTQALAGGVTQLLELILYIAQRHFQLRLVKEIALKG